MRPQYFTVRMVVSPTESILPYRAAGNDAAMQHESIRRIRLRRIRRVSPPGGTFGTLAYCHASGDDATTLGSDARWLPRCDDGRALQ